MTPDPADYTREYGDAIGPVEETPPDALLAHAAEALRTPGPAAVSSFADHFEDHYPNHVGGRLLRGVLGLEPIPDDAVDSLHYATLAHVHDWQPDRRNSRWGPLPPELDAAFVAPDYRVLHFGPDPRRPVDPTTPEWLSPSPLGGRWWRFASRGQSRAWQTRRGETRSRSLRPDVREVTPEEVAREVATLGGAHNLAHLVGGVYYFHPANARFPEAT